MHTPGSARETRLHGRLNTRNIAIFILQDLECLVKGELWVDRVAGNFLTVGSFNEGQAGAPVAVYRLKRLGVLVGQLEVKDLKVGLQRVGTRITKEGKRDRERDKHK